MTDTPDAPPNGTEKPANDAAKQKMVRLSALEVMARYNFAKAVLDGVSPLELMAGSVRFLKDFGGFPGKMLAQQVSATVAAYFAAEEKKPRLVVPNDVRRQ